MLTGGSASPGHENHHGSGDQSYLRSTIPGFLKVVNLGTIRIAIIIYGVMEKTDERRIIGPTHFSQSAWTFDERTNQYYLHIFSRRQPDLNWNNPDLRAEIQRMIAWWLDKGIDGFRLDAINLIAKAEGFPDNQGDGECIFSIEHFKNQPAFHSYMRELYQKVFSRYNVLTVGECASITVDDAIDITAPEREELNMTFLFEHTEYYNLVERDPQKLKEILTRWQIGLHERGWTGIAFNNHDQPRVGVMLWQRH